MIESECRKPGWSDWIAVKLADGQEWNLPRPKVEYLPVFVDDEPTYQGVPGRLSFGVQFERGHSAMEAAGDPAERLQALAEVVAGLLLQNYDLTTEQLEDLLPLVVHEDDPTKPTDESAAMWAALSDAIFLPEPIRRATPDEESVRRDDWRAGTWLRMGDGQFWAFPIPRLSELPDTHFETLTAVLDAETVDDQFALIATLSAANLRINYDLADDDLAGLLPLVRDPIAVDEDNATFWSALLDIVSGSLNRPRRTRTRWLKLATIMATGNPDADLTVEDATDLARLLVDEGKFPPSVLWVDGERERAELEANCSSLNGLI